MKRKLITWSLLALLVSACTQTVLHDNTPPLRATPTPTTPAIYVGR